MYTSFEISNFRLLNRLELTDLKRINLISGRNNVGKTSVLEAIFLHSGQYNPELAVRVNVLRAGGRIELQPRATTEVWSPLFRNFDTGQEIFLVSSDENNQLRTVSFSVVTDENELKKIPILIQPETNGTIGATPAIEPSSVMRLEYIEGKKKSQYYVILNRDGLRMTPFPPAPYESIFFNSNGYTPTIDDNRRFTNLVKSGQRELLLESMRVVDNRVKGFEILTFSGESMIHCHLDEPSEIPLPIVTMGDGFRRMMSILLAIGNAPNGTVLIDEVENGLHYSVLEDIWRGIDQMALEFKTQVFATTHSRECILAAHNAIKNSKNYDLTYTRLDRTKNGTIKPVRYDKDTLEASQEIEVEVR